MEGGVGVGVGQRDGRGSVVSDVGQVSNATARRGDENVGVATSPQSQFRHNVYPTR